VVRAAVARKSAISEETVANFASDSSPEVIGALVNAQCRKLSESAIVQIVQRNWSAVNRDIAHNVESFDQSDTTALAKLLAGSADPSVRAALASNSGSPKVVVRQFLNDPDPDVRRLARNTLKR
jgi:lysozyme family protein